MPVTVKDQQRPRGLNVSKTEKNVSLWEIMDIPGQSASLLKRIILMILFHNCEIKQWPPMISVQKDAGGNM